MDVAQNKVLLYERLANARARFHNLKLKKSGKNKFAGFEYFELEDFLVPLLECLRQEKLVPVVSFDSEFATLTLYMMDSSASLTITSPMAEANLKGCHPIQNAGAVQSYQRRYLYITLAEVCEHDALDSAPLDQDEAPVAKKKAVKTASSDDLDLVAEVYATPDDPFVGETLDDIEQRNKSKDPMEEHPLVIDTDEEADFLVNELLQIAKMHAPDRTKLAEFWKKNSRPIGKLQDDFPKHYASLVEQFRNLVK